MALTPDQQALREQLLNQGYGQQGAPWACNFCATSNPADAAECAGCGRPQGARKQANGQPAQRQPQRRQAQGGGQRPPQGGGDAAAQQRAAQQRAAQQRAAQQRGGGLGGALDDLAPVKRTDLDSVIVPLRWVGAVALIGYSAQSTVVGVANDVTPATGLSGEQATVTFPGAGTMEVRLIVGFVAALVLFVLQILTAERFPWVYRVAVLVDSLYTKRQAQPWITAIVVTAMITWIGVTEAPKYGTIIWFTAEVVGFLVSLGVAYFGEVLLLGRRRKPKEAPKGSA